MFTCTPAPRVYFSMTRHVPTRQPGPGMSTGCVRKSGVVGDRKRWNRIQIFLWMPNCTITSRRRSSGGVGTLPAASAIGTGSVGGSRVPPHPSWQQYMMMNDALGWIEQINKKKIKKHIHTFTLIKHLSSYLHQLKSNH